MSVSDRGAMNQPGQPETRQPETGEPKAPKPLATRPHILIAEDQASLRLLLTATLQRIGARVTEVADGRAALAAARRDPPSLLLLDVGLPELDGYEVCRRLKSEADTASLKIVLVTARGQPQERAAGLAAGADDYLVKPFSPVQLMAAVRGWLGAGGPTVQAASGHTPATDHVQLRRTPPSPSPATASRPLP